jgi:hypothetical protein
MQVRTIVVGRLNDMTEVVFAIVFLATPLLVLPVVLRRDPAASRCSVFALFIVPLVGVATYCLLTPQLSLGTVVVGYPLALVSLGFWAALLAGGGASVLRSTALVERSQPISRVLAAAASGAVVGTIFMLVYSLAGVVVSSGVDTAAVERCAVAGLVAGAVGGGFAGYDLRPRTGVVAR